MTMKTAQLAFIGLTALFFVGSVVLFIMNTALIAAGIMLLGALLGFVVLMSMLMNDSGMSKPQ